MEEYELNALEDQQRAMMEEQMEQAEESAFDYPVQKKSDSLFTLFNKVLGIKDSSKVGNLGATELGMLPIPVRESQRIALIARLLNHNKFAQFFEDQAQIVLTTSASKKGWFTELFVSQKKFTQRESETRLGNKPGGQRKWKMFGGRQQTEA